MFIPNNVFVSGPTLWMDIGRRFGLSRGGTWGVPELLGSHACSKTCILHSDQKTTWCKSVWTGSNDLISHQLTVCCESYPSIITVFIGRMNSTLLLHHQPQKYALVQMMMCRLDRLCCIFARLGKHSIAKFWSCCDPTPDVCIIMYG